MRLRSLSAVVIFLPLFLCVVSIPLRVSAMEPKTPQPPASTEQAVPNENSDETLDLALKGILLSQGEGGLEIWRLKATWANVRKEEDKIVLEEPRLVYFMHDDGKTLHVQAQHGDIKQKKQLLRFMDNVLVSQDDKKITGSLLVYDGLDKIMSFPEGGIFSGTGVSGSAKEISWDINRKLIIGAGGVSVSFDSDQRP